MPVSVARLAEQYLRQRNLTPACFSAENIVLATVEGKQPRARYHVHRGFVKDGEKDLPLLLTTTDKLMPKGE